MELKSLAQYLMQFKNSIDIRADHCSQMKLDQYPRFENPLDLLSQLYPDVYTL